MSWRAPVTGGEGRSFLSGFVCNIKGHICSTASPTCNRHRAVPDDTQPRRVKPARDCSGGCPGLQIIHCWCYPDCSDCAPV